jgi:hypothetical protein
LFDLPNSGLFVFCERVREKAVRWEKRHKGALKGHFTSRQERKEVPWPYIPADFEDWAQEGTKASVEKRFAVFCLCLGKCVEHL